MIVSHKLRCIFIAVPKTATHAIRFALREHMGPDDVEQVGLFVQKQSPYPGVRDKGHGHIEAVELRDAVGAETWADYFSFAFVRNPWDRFVSNFFFLFRGHPDVVDNPFRFMPEFFETAQQKNELHMRPQYGFLHDEGGACLVDFVGRYETLQRNYEAVCEKLGIAPQELEKVNSSTRGDYRLYYTDELRAAVAEKYAKDIAAFGYEFDESATRE